MANFEVLPDQTVQPWLTFERHLTVLRGLWEHQPSTAYPEVSVPTLLIVAETGEVNWTASKSDAACDAVAALTTGRAHWFRPAHHDVHAQHPTLVAALLHDAVTAPDFFDTAYSHTDTDTGTLSNTEPPR